MRHSARSTPILGALGPEADRATLMISPLMTPRRPQAQLRKRIARPLEGPGGHFTHLHNSSFALALGLDGWEPSTNVFSMSIFI